MSPARLTNEEIASRITVSESGCWLYGAKSSSPRGYVRIGGEWGHRYMYEQHVGPIPPGLEIDHTCAVTNCVNPDHLEAVSREENVRRAVARRHVCRNGHPREQNRRPGTSECRACHRDRERERKQRIRNGLTPAPPIRIHGIVTSYQYGCRCRPCTAANAAASKRFRQERPEYFVEWYRKRKAAA